MPKLGCFLFLLLLIGPSARAAITEKDCPTIRLDQGNGPLANIPVYDQRAFADNTDSDICYAVTASQLIDAHRFYEENKTPKQLSSPLSLAITATHVATKWSLKQRISYLGLDKIVGMGAMDKAIKLTADNPVCDQNWLNQFEGSFGRENRILPEHQKNPWAQGLYPSKRNFLTAMEKEVKNYREELQKAPFLAGARRLLGWWKDPDPSVTTDFFACYVNENVIPAENILKAVRAAADFAAPVETLHDFLQTFCAEHSFKPRIPEPKLYDRTHFRPKDHADYTGHRGRELSRIVQQSLGADQPKPVGVEYCGNIASSSEQKGIKDTYLQLFYNDCGFHASVIVGQRFSKKTNSCEFLVRNSYGPGCKYLPGAGEYIRECENGSFWIGTDELMKSTFGLITL